MCLVVGVLLQWRYSFILCYPVHHNNKFKCLKSDYNDECGGMISDILVVIIIIIVIPDQTQGRILCVSPSSFYILLSK